MKHLMFGENINGTDETGIIYLENNKPKILCLCTKKNAEIIINKFKQCSGQIVEGGHRKERLNPYETAPKVLNRFVDFDRTNNNDLIKFDCTINAMQEYADQFKYDYSQSCRCEEGDRIGETWCCNTCGLPVDNESKQKNIETLRHDFYMLFEDSEIFVDCWKDIFKFFEPLIK